MKKHKTKKASLIIRLEPDLLDVLTSAANLSGKSRNAYISHLLYIAGECLRGELSEPLEVYLSDLTFLKEVIKSEKK